MSVSKATTSSAFKDHNVLIAYLLQILEQQYKIRSPALDSNVMSWIRQTVDKIGDTDSINSFVSLSVSSKCVACTNDISTIKLNCNHHLCTSCISEILKNASNSNLNYPAVFKCPVCPYTHTSREMQYVAKDLWAYFLAEFNKNRIKQNIDQKCDSCQIQM